MPSGIARICNDARAARTRFHVLHSAEHSISMNSRIDTCTCDRSDIRSDICSDIRDNNRRDNRRDIRSDIHSDATPGCPDRGSAARCHGCGGCPRGMRR